MTFYKKTSFYLPFTKEEEKYNNSLLLTDSLGQPTTEDPAYVCDPWEIVINQGMKALFVKPPSRNALWGKEGPAGEPFLCAEGFGLQPRLFMLGVARGVDCVLRL